MNTSGIDPLDMRVLVKPDPAADRIGSIILADQTKEQNKHSSVKATLVAVGINAWCEAKAARGFIAPKAGARVMIAKYGGVVVKGDDGEEYRIMNDEDVVGLLKEAV
jgi:chaperonin GroES